jgi:DNA recombination protein RmuC
MEIIYLIVGFVIGGLLAWLLTSAMVRNRQAGLIANAQARAESADAVSTELRNQAAKLQADVATLQAQLDSEKAARVQAQTQYAESARNLQEQKTLLENAKTHLGDSFKALSGDALKSNNQAFLELARKSLDAVVAEAKGDAGKRQEAIDSLIKPLTESLKRYELQVKALEDSRQRAYGALQEQMVGLSSAHQLLQKETGNLVTALRAPQVRGRWGEVTLHRVVELAGMSEHCDYSQQVSVDTAGGKLRPDMVVHLPGGRDVVVDSKVSMEAYLRAVEAQTPQQREACLKQHSQQLRAHMQKLSDKEYWKQFDKAPEFVVMFIPGESFFAAALDCDPALLEDGMERRVIMGTPTTLVALLKAVAYGWRQEKMAANAQEICELGKELHSRIGVLASHLVKLGVGLKNANEAYNHAVGSMETRLMPQARKFKELGATGADEIPVIEPMDITPRKLSDESAESPPV